MYVGRERDSQAELTFLALLMLQEITEGEGSGIQKALRKSLTALHHHRDRHRAARREGSRRCFGGGDGNGEGGVACLSDLSDPFLSAPAADDPSTLLQVSTSPPSNSESSISESSGASDTSSPTSA